MLHQCCTKLHVLLALGVLEVFVKVEVALGLKKFEEKFAFPDHAHAACGKSDNVEFRVTGFFLFIILTRHT